MDWDSPHPDPFRWGWEEHDLWVTVSRRERIFLMYGGVFMTPKVGGFELHLHSINKTRAIPSASPFSTEGGPCRCTLCDCEHDLTTSMVDSTLHGSDSRGVVPAGFSVLRCGSCGIVCCPMSQTVAIQPYP